MALASFNKGATLIALRALPALAGRSFAPGDVVPWLKLDVSERRVGQLIGNRKLGELTQENFDYAIKQRSSQDLPKGHTPAGLEALGIRFKPPAPPAKAHFEVEYDSELAHRGYLVRGRKMGRFTRFDLFNTAGERLNAGGMLSNMKTVDTFLDTLEAEQMRLRGEQNTEQTGAGEGGGNPAAPAGLEQVTAPLLGDDGQPLNPPSGDLSAAEPMGGDDYGEGEGDHPPPA